MRTSSHPVKRKRLNTAGASEFIEEESSQAQASGTGDDKVTVNVGGKRFVAATSTLVSNSAYFEALLSSRWSSSSRTTEPIFIDHVPEAFGHLLAYMRSGIVSLPSDLELSKLVLVQAQFLGIHGFLTSVKSTAYRRIFRHNDLVKNEVVEAESFDDKYGTLEAAIGAGILPQCYFTPSENMQIRIHDRVLLAPKNALVVRSSFFRKLLTAHPVDYWKDEVVLCGNPDVYEVVLHWFCGQRLHVSSMLEKSMKNVVSDADADNARKNFALDVGNVMNYLGMAAIGDEDRS